MAAMAIAHRAGNSLAGLQAANALGVDVIECDVHEHRGRLEVRHLKTAGPLPFLWDRWELASASAPRLGLAELLARGRARDDLHARPQGPPDEYGDRRGHACCTSGGHHRPVLVCGRFWPSVEVLAELPFVRPVLSARNRAELARLRRVARAQRRPAVRRLGAPEPAGPRPSSPSCGRASSW